MVTPTPPTAAPTATAATSLRLASVGNFRDVAGTGLPLADGSQMRTGVVYRSGKLSTISAADLRRLRALGLSDIIDLRTNYVARRSPDPAVPGAEHHLINLFAVYRSPAASFSSVSKARAHMRSLNRGFVAQKAQRAQIAEVLKLIATADGPVLVHCTEGKDRTGWISAILQLVAGADREQVVAEYLKSNTFRSAQIAKAGKVKRALLKVDASYLNAGLAEMDRRYGGLDGYLHDGLGLSTSTLNSLRGRLRG